MDTQIITASSGTQPYAVTLSDGAGHQWTADEPLASGGGDTAATPTQLLLSSLGACTVITLQMYAARKQWPLTGIDVQLHYIPNEAGVSGTGINRRITLHGALSPEQNARLLQVANACPVHKILTGAVNVATAITA
jgi:putative redox protein